MLNDNIKNLRKAKEMSQEQLAEKLNVVRQTVSKWEKGLSVPDAEMLIQLAAALDTTVAILLGETVISEGNSELKSLAQRLEALNAQFAKQKEKRRKIWRIAFTVLGAVTVGALLFELAAFLHLQAVTGTIQEDVTIIGGADGPTSILVSSSSLNIPSLIISVVALAISVIGIYKTRK